MMYALRNFRSLIHQFIVPIGARGRNGTEFAFEKQMTRGAMHGR